MRREIWITHQTAYEFDRPVDGVDVRVRLRPVDDHAQRVIESELHCRPRPHERVTVTGAERLVFRGPLRRIEVTGQTRLGWDPSAEPQAEGEPPALAAAPAWAVQGTEIWRWARQALPDREPGRAEIDAFMALIRRDFTFDPRATDATTAVPRFFSRRRGVCQDYAGLAAGCLRARGVPVNVVFGYLIREPAGGHGFEEGQPHAWLSSWAPGAGWRDVDPTTGLAPPSHHVTLRRGRRLRDIQPVAGRVHGPPVGQQLRVHVTVVKNACTS